MRHRLGGSGLWHREPAFWSGVKDAPLKKDANRKTVRDAEGNPEYEVKPDAVIVGHGRNGRPRIENPPRT